MLMFNVSHLVLVLSIPHMQIHILIGGILLENRLLIGSQQKVGLVIGYKELKTR